MTILSATKVHDHFGFVTVILRHVMRQHAPEYAVLCECFACVAYRRRVRFAVAVPVLGAAEVHGHFGFEKIARVLFCSLGAFW